MAVLSNTSRRRAHALSKLPTLGFDAAKLAEFVCSPESRPESTSRRAQGSACFGLGGMSSSRRQKATCSRSRSFSLAPSPSLPLPLHTASCEQAWDPHYLDGLDLRLADAATADFVFLQGSQTLRDGSRATPTEATQLLECTPQRTGEGWRSSRERGGCSGGESPRRMSHHLESPRLR